ncbi:MAG: molybdate ABC transporter substrate-binding protein [Candidatus Marinimicrobia bacterium]|nr:molybdate ABC transporter substrate-binding protein [Candidatus Neomarinimicrobiota bacterium]
MNQRLLYTLLAVFLATHLSCADNNQSEEVVVYAAASLSDVMTEVGEQYEDSTGINVVFNFAGSNILARQIVAANSADLFLSANEEWMDYVQENQRVIPESRVSLLSNSLVVIANRSDDKSMEAADELCNMNIRFLALGNPDAVPAGRYAREWLRSISCGDQNAWDLLAPLVSPAPDVRAAMGLVESASDIIGIVYRTDAAMSEKVKVLYQVPKNQGPDISYSLAQLKNAPNPERADAFLGYLQSEQAAGIFNTYGFTTLIKK